MKYLILFCVLLSGCASGPTKVLMKNCDAVGSGLYSCEEIPNKDIGRNGGGRP